MSNDLSNEYKADLIADAVIKANPMLEKVHGKEMLREHLAKGLVEGHQKGDFSLDKMIVNERGKDDRSDGRSR
jgi:hypothetical protein